MVDVNDYNSFRRPWEYRDSLGGNVLDLFKKAHELHNRSSRNGRLDLRIGSFKEMMDSAGLVHAVSEGFTRSCISEMLKIAEAAVRQAKEGIINPHDAIHVIEELGELAEHSARHKGNEMKLSHHDRKLFLRVKGQIGKLRSKIEADALKMHNNIKLNDRRRKHSDVSSGAGEDMNHAA